MRIAKSIEPAGKFDGKPTSMLTLAHSPVWSNVRFASPPGLKEDNL